MICNWIIVNKQSFFILSLNQRVYNNIFLKNIFHPIKIKTFSMFTAKICLENIFKVKPVYLLQTLPDLINALCLDTID